MGKWLIIYSFLGVMLTQPVFSQSSNESLPKGGRSMGMGNTNATLVDGWSVFNNIGGLSRISESKVFFGYDHRLQLNELTTIAAGAALKRESSAWGVGVSSYGGAFFNQRLAGLGYSNQMGITSIGIKLNYLQTSIEGAGTAGAAIIEFGGIAELTPELFFGAHIFNLTSARYSKNTTDRLPTIVKAGISYRPSEKVMVNVEAEKDISLDAILKVGLEYNLLNRIWGRAGMNTNPNNLFFGIGFKPKRFQLDYAMTQNTNLGNTHHFSLNYHISGKQ